MVHITLNRLIIFLFMLFICLNLTKEHWHNFSNDVNGGMTTAYDSTKLKSTYYEEFYSYLNHEINLYQNNTGKWLRNVDPNEVALEQREKTRWVFNTFIIKAFTLAENISKNQTFYPKEKVALYLYSIFIGIFLFLTFIFLYLKIKLLSDTNNLQKQKYYQDPLVYSFFAFFLVIAYINFVHYRGGEDNFSIFETFCISAALYFVELNKKWSILVYIIICMIAPLIRESGIFISIYFFVFHLFFFKKIKLYGLLIPFISLVPYVLANFDLFKFYLDDGFIFTLGDIETQTTLFDFSNNLVGTMNALFYNVIIFIAPIVIFFKRNNKLQIFLLSIISFYFILLIMGSVLDHLSTRFMPSIFIIIYTYVGIHNIEIQDKKLNENN